MSSAVVNSNGRKIGDIMKIGFIGLGNMAAAMIGGMLKKEIVQPQDIIGSDKNTESMEKINKQLSINVTAHNSITAESADILFLSVKPIVLPEVIAEISQKVKQDTIIVSIVAGQSLARLEELFGRNDLKLIRCMPNTPALILEGCTGVCAGSRITSEELEKVMSLLRSFGTAHIVPERLMDAVVGISGSSPAYVFMFIEAMADAAVAAGMPRAQAYEFAAQAVAGSARMVLQTGKHPGELKDMVCSPGGTTIQAVKVLEEKGFRGVVMDAVEACIEQSGRL